MFYLAGVLFVFFKYNYLLIKEMVKRPKHDQTCHNTSVAKRAAGLKANGWKVKADIKGYTTPSTLNGRRPDIVAKKGKKTRIIEVETQNSKRRDSDQHKDLRDYANSHKNTEFRMRTCKT